jgi:AcrR family transcriptional regulator
MAVRGIHLDREGGDCIFPTPLRHERAEAAMHRCRILEAARALFDAHGVEAISMHQIAQAAGVGQGTLYRRYAHKGELCLDLLQEGGQRFYDDMESYQAANAERPALERLDGVLGRCVTLLEEKAHYLSAIAEASCGERQSLRFKTGIYPWLHRTVDALLQEAVRAGELAPLDTAFTADAMLAALNPALYLYQRHERGMSPAAIQEGLRRLYITGLHPSPATHHAAHAT